MKRLIFAAVVIVSLGALTIWGDRILARTLDAELAPLLTKQLGLPVQLGPLQTRVIALKATTPKLIMGDPKDPAVVATSVEVTLAWADLLKGEVRLVYASADDLMVRPSRWPSSGKPLPDNYNFLDPYLPRKLEFETGRYVSDSGEEYPLNQLQWQRKFSGAAMANWVEQRSAGDIAMALQLTSLADLLQLAPVEAELTINSEGNTDSTVTLKAKVQPATKSAYALQLDLDAGGMSAQMAATGKTAWALPDASKTTIPLLDSTKVKALLKSYSASDKNTGFSTLMVSTLPRLELPVHKGHVAITEVHLADEITKDNAFDFTTGAQGVQVSALTSSGPASILTGELGVVSDAQGWTFNLDSNLQARKGSGSIAPQYLGSDWLLRTGRATLKGQGGTWGALLNSLQGDAAISGHYDGAVDTPIAITAKLDKHAEAFALEHIAITLGEGHLSGSASLSGTDTHTLNIDLRGSQIDLDFLFEKKDAEPLPGMALPEYLAIFPDLELNVTLDVDGLKSPALQLSQAKATLNRTPQGGTLVLDGKGVDSGVLDLKLEATTPADADNTTELTANFKELDISEMFQQQGLLHSRSSGKLEFISQGGSMQDIFAAMKGTANMSVQLRADDNWQRNSSAEETLQFTGSSSLVVKGDRIVGVEIENLDIDSIEQDLTGNISLVAGRSPWFEAELKSDKLDINGLIALLPTSEDKTEDSTLLPSLQRLGAAKASLDVKSLILYDIHLTEVKLDVLSGANSIDLQQVDFLTENGAFQSQGAMTWKGDKATLEGTAEVTNVDLDQFIIRGVDVKHVPVSGSAKVDSEGRSIAELLANLTGYIDLQAVNTAQGSDAQSRRKIAMKATRLPDGMETDISSLQWGESELTGTVRYRKTTPPLLEVEIRSGSLSLLPWENAYLKSDTREKDKSKKTSVSSVAKKSADFVGDVLLTPLRFLAGDENEPRPGAKLFSSDPLPLASLQKFNAKISAQFDSLLSSAVTAKGINVTGNLTGGQLTLKAQSTDLSQGSGEIDVALDANAVPATLKLTSTFENMHGLSTRENTYPRSGFISLQSQGQSQAELAAGVNGLVFVKLGQGPFDYANSALLTSNISTTVFQTLIPGIDKKQQQMECGVTVALFKDGQGVTPYGFAARTNQANLLGQIHLDLAKETLQMSLDSRGREGVGISVGSIFSNTVQIKGPLTDPGIVPDATSLIWRGWAAVMTGGLSVLGESLVKRVLANENPCKSIEKLIAKELCPTNPIAASSPMVCPTT